MCFHDNIKKYLLAFPQNYTQLGVALACLGNSVKVFEERKVL